MTNHERLEIMAAIILSGALPDRITPNESVEEILRNGPKIAWKLAKEIHELSNMEPNL